MIQSAIKYITGPSSWGRWLWCLDAVAILVGAFNINKLYTRTPTVDDEGTVTTTIVIKIIVVVVVINWNITIYSWNKYGGGDDDRLVVCRRVYILLIVYIMYIIYIRYNIRIGPVRRCRFATLGHDRNELGTITPRTNVRCTLRIA